MRKRRERRGKSEGKELIFEERTEKEGEEEEGVTEEEE